MASIQSLRYLLRPNNPREAVGGFWDQIGTLQLEFLKSQGLQRQQRLLDIGCGSLRGGVRFVEYLDPGNYYGLDIDPALLNAGRRELAKAGVDDRNPQLLVDDAFRFDKFPAKFDFAIAQSVFTHLPFNPIMRCLAEVEKALAPGGRLYATFYLNPGPRLNLKPHRQPHAGAATMDADPFYYDPDMFRWAVEGSTLSFELIGDWNHPRNQQMMVFAKTS